MAFCIDPFVAEHIHPVAKGGSTIAENLAFACIGCNGYKQDKTEAFDGVSQATAPLYHPRTDRWHDHFTWNEDLKRRLSTPLKLLIAATVMILLAVGVYRLFIAFCGAGPLFDAAERGDTAKALKLLDSGINPDDTDEVERNRTPLMYAAARNDRILVRALITHGANVNARDNHGFSALDWVGSEDPERASQHKEVIAMLKKAGAHR